VARPRERATRRRSKGLLGGQNRSHLPVDLAQAHLVTSLRNRRCRARANDSISWRNHKAKSRPSRLESPAVSRPRPRRPGAEDVNLQLIKAMAHPLRYRLLVRLNAGVASPVEMAREFDQPVGRVSHHVRTLARLGAIELVRTEPRRGAVEHFYRAVIPAWFSDEDWARLPPSARLSISGENLAHVLRDVTDAAGHGFEHPRTHLSFKPLELDEQAMEEMSELLNATLERALEIEQESARRGGAASPTEVVLMHFVRQA
jgi:hypothetical protein